jgi:hypothetical protein
MYFGGSQHSGTDEGWRHRVTDVLQEHGAIVFNPWRKPAVRGLGSYGREGEQNQPYRERFGYADTDEGAVGRAHCARKALPMLHVDLRMIDTSDLMIAFCPTSVYSVGTVHEIARAREQRKPVLLVTPPTVFPALDRLRTHLAADSTAQALLDELTAQASLRPNPGAAPVAGTWRSWTAKASSTASASTMSGISTRSGPTSPRAGPPTAATNTEAPSGTTTGCSFELLAIEGAHSRNAHWLTPKALSPSEDWAAGMEHLWSRAGATGGNRSQSDPPRKSLKQASSQPRAAHDNGMPW